jgi:hypothetical protein
MLPEQVAEVLGVTVGTLNTWRYKSTAAKPLGPAFVKLNRSVRYEPDAVDAYIESLRPKSNVTPIARKRSA